MSIVWQYKSMHTAERARLSETSMQVYGLEGCKGKNWHAKLLFKWGNTDVSSVEVHS
jgi:hypothetical protein